MGLFSPRADRLIEKGYNNIYYKGKLDKGLQQMEEAAQAGNKTAVFFLAELYNTGRAEGGYYDPLTVTPDPEKALALYRQLPQILRVKFRLAEFYASGPAALRDEVLAWQLFNDVKQGRAEPDWGDLWMAYRFHFEGGADDETLRRQAGMRAAVMQFWGRGVQRDDAQVEKALDEYESTMHKEKAAKKEYWDPDALFCLEALRLRQLGAETYYGDRYISIALERLVWAYTSTADPATEQLLEEEMLVPRLIPKLQESVQQDTPFRMRDILDAMQTVSRKKSAYSISFGDAGYECLEEVEDKFFTEKYYRDYFSCLEKCSGGLGNLRATCLLAQTYLAIEVTHYSAVVNSMERKIHVREDHFEQETRRTLARMANQIKVRKEGKRQGERADRGMSKARLFMNKYGEAAKKVAPEECRQIEHLL